jgi:hypothetical protein
LHQSSQVMDDELADDHLKKDRNSELDSQSHERENNVGEKVVFWGHFCDLWDVSRRAYVAVAYFVYQKDVCSEAELMAVYLSEFSSLQPLS